MNNTQDLLERLVKLVGGMNVSMQQMREDILELKKEQQEMKAEIQGIKSEIREMKKDILEMKAEIQEIKAEQKIMNNRMDKLEMKVEQGFRKLKADLDFIWEKTIRTEREVEKLRRL